MKDQITKMGKERKNEFLPNMVLFWKYISHFLVFGKEQKRIREKRREGEEEEEEEEDEEKNEEGR